MRMLKLVCESLQTMYSLQPSFSVSVESFYFWSLYGVFEQQRLISTMAQMAHFPFQTTSQFRIPNSEFRIPNPEISTTNFGIRNCEVYIIWASGNS